MKELINAFSIKMPTQDKAHRCVASFLGVLLFCGFLATMGVTGLGLWRTIQGTGSYDFACRWSEVQALRQGIDPYDIWIGQIIHPDFFPTGTSWFYKNKCRIDFFVNWENCESIAERQTVALKTTSQLLPPVASYPPNAYTVLLPLGKLPLKTSLRIWFLISIGAYLFAVLSIYWWVTRRMVFPSWKQTLFLILCVAGFAPGAWNGQMIFGNYIALHLFSLVLLILSLERGEYIARRRGRRIESVFWQCLGGIAFGLLLIKPQAGILFGIPLLFSRKWLTIAIAGTLSIAACFPPAMMCGKSPVELLNHLSNSGIPWYSGTAFIPSILQDRLWLLGLGRIGMTASALMGIATCVILSWRTRKDADWIVRLLPAIVLAPLWTFAWTGDALVYMPFVMVFFLHIINHEPDWKICAFCVAVAMVVTNKLCPFGERDIYSRDFFKMALLIGFTVWIYRHHKP